MIGEVLIRLLCGRPDCSGRIVGGLGLLKSTLGQVNRLFGGELESLAQLIALDRNRSGIVRRHFADDLVDLRRDSIEGDEGGVEGGLDLFIGGKELATCRLLGELGHLALGIA